MGLTNVQRNDVACAQTSLEQPHHGDKERSEHAEADQEAYPEQQRYSKMSSRCLRTEQPSAERYGGADQHAEDQIAQQDSYRRIR